MLFVKYRLVCDNCLVNELPLESTLMENVLKEIDKSEWQTMDIYNMSHLCPECQKLKGGKLIEIEESERLCDTDDGLLDEDVIDDGISSDDYEQQQSDDKQINE